MADPHRPQPCEVANSVAVFKELSKVELDRKAAIGSLAKTPHSHRLGLLDWRK